MNTLRDLLKESIAIALLTKQGLSSPALDTHASEDEIKELAEDVADTVLDDCDLEGIQKLRKELSYISMLHQDCTNRYRKLIYELNEIQTKKHIKIKKRRRSGNGSRTNVKDTLKLVRSLFGFSQVYLSDKTGVSQRYISSVERGVFCASLDLVSKIAAVTQMDENWISTGKGSPFINGNKYSFIIDSISKVDAINSLLMYVPSQKNILKIGHLSMTAIIYTDGAPTIINITNKYLSVFNELIKKLTSRDNSKGTTLFNIEDIDIRDNTRGRQPTAPALNQLSYQ